MAAVEDFNITDTKARDIFRYNHPPEGFWIVTRRYFDSVFMRGYDTNTNVMNNNVVVESLNDLNNHYTYIRRNPAGGRKRQSVKSRKSKRRKVRKSRRH